MMKRLNKIWNQFSRRVDESVATYESCEEHKLSIIRDAVAKNNPRPYVLRDKAEDCKTQDEFRLFYFHQQALEQMNVFINSGQKLWDLPNCMQSDTLGYLIRNHVNYAEFI